MYALAVWSSAQTSYTYDGTYRTSYTYDRTYRTSCLKWRWMVVCTLRVKMYEFIALVPYLSGGWIQGAGRSTHASLPGHRLPFATHEACV